MHVHTTLISIRTNMHVHTNYMHILHYTVCPANGPVMVALSELAEEYIKGGKIEAAISYKKVGIYSCICVCICVSVCR